MGSSTIQCPQDTPPPPLRGSISALTRGHGIKDQGQGPPQIRPLPLETLSGWLRLGIHGWSSEGHTEEVMITRRGGASLLLTCTVYSVPAAAAGPVLHCPLDGVRSAAHAGMLVSGWSVVAFMGLDEKQFTTGFPNCLFRLSTLAPGPVWSQPARTLLTSNPVPGWQLPNPQITNPFSSPESVFASACVVSFYRNCDQFLYRSHCPPDSTIRCMQIIYSHHQKPSQSEGPPSPILQLEH